MRGWSRQAGDEGDIVIARDVGAERCYGDVDVPYTIGHNAGAPAR
jgi:hypothetical protein